MIQKLQQLAADKRAALQESEGGFTLIELLVVVVIIGILIAIAIPLYLNYQKGAHDKSAQSDLRAAVSAINQCFTDNANAYPTTVTWSGSVGTPVGSGDSNPCANDKINLSSGTHMYYALATPGGASYTLAASNDGGNRNDSTSASTATAAGTGYYFYDSSKGGAIQ